MGQTIEAEGIFRNGSIWLRPGIGDGMEGIDQLVLGCEDQRTSLSKTSTHTISVAQAGKNISIFGLSKFLADGFQDIFGLRVDGFGPVIQEDTGQVPHTV